MKTSFTGNGHNKPFCPILLENTTFVKGLVQVKGLSPTGEKAPQGNFCHERRSACTPLAKNSSLALVFLECRGKSHQKRPLKPMVSTLPLRGFGVVISTISATRIRYRITSGRKPALSHTSLCAAALPLFGR